MQRRESEPGTALSVLKVFLFTDLVESTAWKKALGDRDYAVHVLAPHDRLFRALLADFPRAALNNDMGDGYLATFPTPGEAVQFALQFHAALVAEPWGEAVRRSGRVPATRVGIHLGEHIELDQPGTPKLSGQAVDLAARVMGLALPGQTLLTRHAFDSARQFVRENPADPTRPLAFVAHGLYRFKGNDDDPLEVFGVAPDGSPELAPPPDSEKARRVQVDAEDDTGAWRPAVGLAIPGRDGWRLERPLGDGGFGEVWLARHLRTKDQRVFKFCFDADRLRSFKRELTLFRLVQSEFGSRTDFVRLYDVQFHRPPYYLESEYVAGGNLVGWVAARGFDSWPVVDRIQFVAAAARTVAAAHSLGIIHKDIKPANILVRESGGRPHPVVADFGIGVLTDRSILDQRQITATGGAQTLAGNESSRTGTRLYAPPESLMGKPASTGHDVYALGVVLYQALVGDFGQPLGTGWEENLKGLPHAELLADDIRTATLPAERRLGTVTLLAERLETLAERDHRLGLERRAEAQVRRARLLGRALVASTSILILVGGLAAYAWQQAETARVRTKDAEDATGLAEQEKRKALQAEHELRGRNDDLKRTLAKALFGPISPCDCQATLTPYESEALLQVSQLREDAVALMFLEAATRTPLAWKKLECRSQYVFHAAIGLNRGRRDEADRRLLAQLRASALPSDQLLSLRLSVLNGGFASPELLLVAASPLADLPRRNQDFDERANVADALVAAALRMDHTDRAKISAAAALALSKAIAEGPGLDDRRALARSLSRVAPWMSPADDKQIKEVAKSVAASLRAEKDVMTGMELALALSAVTERMEPRDAADTLVDALAQPGKRGNCPDLHEGLVVAVSRMEAARREAYLIAEAEAVAEALVIPNNEHIRKNFCKALAKLSVAMEPAEGSRALTQALKKERDPIAREWLGKGLAVVAARMNSIEGTEARREVYNTLMSGLAASKTGDNDDMDLLDYQKKLIATRAAMAARRCPHEGVRFFAELLTSDHAKVLHPRARVYLAEVLAAVAQMSPEDGRKQCANVAHFFAGAVGSEPNSYARANLAEALAMVAWMTPDGGEMTSAAVAHSLANAVSSESDSEARSRLAKALAAVTRLSPKENRRHCSKVAHSLAKALDSETNWRAKVHLAIRLTEMLRMAEVDEPSIRVNASNTLLVSFPSMQSTDPDRIGVATGRLAVAILRRHNPNEGKQLYATAVRSLVEMQSFSSPPYDRERLIEGLAEARESNVADPEALVAALAKTKSPDVSLILSTELLAIERKSDSTSGTRSRGAATRNVLEADQYLFRRDAFTALIFGVPLRQIDLPDNNNSIQMIKWHMLPFSSGAFLRSSNPLSVLPLLPQFHLRPLPAQDLVELLKHPFCVGEARRIVLDGLEFTYQQPFTDQWVFVKYAKEFQPHLDLDSPISFSTP